MGSKAAPASGNEQPDVEQEWRGAPFLALAGGVLLAAAEELRR
jgi:hypothetical protein